MPAMTGGIMTQPLVGGYLGDRRRLSCGLKDYQKIGGHGGFFSNKVKILQKIK